MSVLIFVSRLGLYTSGLIAGFGIWGDPSNIWGWLIAALILSVLAHGIHDLATAVEVENGVRRDRLHD